MLLYLAIFLIAIEVCLKSLVRSLRSDFQWLITASHDTCKMPDPESAARFFQKGFDDELGWDRKPNTQKIEVVKTIGEYRPNAKQAGYKINACGARHNPSHEEWPIRISTYGDSFAFSRHVDDNESWQWHLSELTKSNVINFGVGNYGADQALLRFMRKHVHKPAPITILMVVPETISRVVNVWKHYSEYGNLLGFKGRYKVNSMGQLNWLPNPIQSLNDYSKIRERAEHIQSNDDCYQMKFKKDLLKQPYILSIARRPQRHLRLLSLLIKRKRELNKKSIRENVVNAPWSFILEQNRKFIKRLYGSTHHQELLRKIVLKFRDEAARRGTTPVFVMTPYLHDLYDYRRANAFYKPFTDGLKGELSTLDLTDSLSREKRLEELYVSNFFGAHLSPKGNQLVAEKIHNFLLQENLLHLEKASTNL